MSNLLKPSAVPPVILVLWISLEVVFALS